MAAKALGHQMNRVVHVDRKKLIETLKKNREKHIKVYEEAMDGYQEMATKKIEDAFVGLDKRIKENKKKALDKIVTFSKETSDKFSDYFLVLEGISIHMKVPVSFVEAYDTAIDMAEFDTRDTLELSGAEFQCFCRDVWDWTHEFSSVNTAYLKAK